MNSRELLEHALGELDRMISMPLEKQLAWARSLKMVLPPTVPAPKGGSLFISVDGARSLRKLSDKLRQANPTIKSSISAKRHYFSVEHAFGRVIAHVSENKKNEDLYQVFTSELHSSLAGNIQDSEHFFPCHIFVVPRRAGEPVEQPPSFTVGPVRFVSKDDFVRDIQSRGPDSASVVENLHADPSVLPGIKGLLVEGLRDAIDGSPWVASIVIRQTDSDMAQERAATCARLAVAIVRLITGQFEAQQLRISADPHLPQRSQALSAKVGGELNVAVGRRSDGVPIAVDALVQWIANTGEARQTMGNRLAALASPRSSASYPLANGAWLTALYWFARGCTDNSDVDAVVSFGACLDAISSGGGTEKGILAGLSKLLRRKADDKVTTGGLTLSEVVYRLYRQDRSQFIHGARSPYFEDLEDDRSLGGRFCQYALWSASDAIVKYTATAGRPDEYKLIVRGL